MESEDNLAYVTPANLTLSHPTPEERNTIWTNTSSEWRDALDLPTYLQESQYLITIPLAKDNNLTLWILVDKTLPPAQRKILCSCETFRKHALLADSNGAISKVIVHGIASVFSPIEYRGRGYAALMMKELATALRGWQSDATDCVGSILYSDIGKKYYAKLGWHPHPRNSHLVFKPSKISSFSFPPVRHILEADLEDLCRKDFELINKMLAVPSGSTKRLVIVPDCDHILWHIRKADFACNYLFGKKPAAKGAIAGPLGSRVWVVWTHRYYEHPDKKSGCNTLYILRLVLENPALLYSKNGKGGHEEQMGYLSAVLESAWAEAEEWKLDQVKLWNPEPVVTRMIGDAGIEYEVVEREGESIASGLWYDENGKEGEAPEWLCNEHYAWC